MSLDLVTIKPVRPAAPAIRARLLGDDELTGGKGGWETVARPRGRAATEWVGNDPYTHTIPLILDGMETRPGVDTSVEATCRRLERLGLRRPRTGQPPILAVNGKLLRAPKGLRWVLMDLQWGAQVRGRGGRRIQQEVTVVLLEYVRAQVLIGPAAKARGRG